MLGPSPTRRGCETVATSKAKDVRLGSFATAEEAALSVARSPKGRAEAKRASEPPPIPPMTREQALQQAQAEGITLRKADNKTGYANVSKKAGSKIKPYMATWRWRVAIGSK